MFCLTTAPEYGIIDNRKGKAMPKKAKTPITAPIRKAVIAAGNLLRIEQETGIHRGSLSRFARGLRGLHSDALDALAVYFGLELKAKRKGGE